VDSVPAGGDRFLFAFDDRHVAAIVVESLGWWQHEAFEFLNKYNPYIFVCDQIDEFLVPIATFSLTFFKECLQYGWNYARRFVIFGW